jgi:hypothetical protein
MRMDVNETGCHGRPPENTCSKARDELSSLSLSVFRAPMKGRVSSGERSIQGENCPSHHCGVRPHAART